MRPQEGDAWAAGTGGGPVEGEATVSLTNPGGLGTVHSVPRLMSGQSVIMGVGERGLRDDGAAPATETLARGTSIPAFPAPPTPTAPVPPSDTDDRPADGTLAWPRELSPKFPLAAGQEHLGDAGCGEDTDVPGAAVGDVGQSFEAESWQAHLEVLHLMVVQLPHRD